MSYKLECQYKFPIQNNGITLYIGCGQCYACRVKQTMEWTERFKYEMKTCYTAKFPTLTYSPENLPTVEISNDDGEAIQLPTLVKDHLRKYLHRLRFFDKEARKKRTIPGLTKMLYYAVGEYGEHEKRPHYHLVLLNMHPDAIDKIQDTWKYGSAKVLPLNDAGINYVLSDLIKQIGQTFHPDQQKPFRMISHGIGQKYVDHLGDYHKKNDMPYIYKNHKKQPLPKYMEKKLFPDKKLNRFTYVVNRSLNQVKIDENLELIKSHGYENEIHFQIEAEAQRKRKRNFYKSTRL